jgi:uncharacterized protein (TIGR01777 family)
MKVVASGASGQIGSALIPALTAAGHDVVKLVRKAPGAGGAHWDPDAGVIDPGVLAGADAVVHLGGVNVSGGRWTARRKARILDSRVRSTALLARTMAAPDRKPVVFVCASGIHYYGDRGDTVVDEATGPGRGFLAEVCRRWEEATRPASAAGIRVVNLRLGPVFSPSGGPLEKMLRPVRLGVGGVVGKGRQYIPWIDVDDAIGAVAHLLITDSVSGPVNIVSPNPVTNLEWTRTAGKVLGRPTRARVPSFALRLVLGQMAEELVLASIRARPRRLLDSGYRFRYPTVELSLRHLLGRV